MQIDRVAVIIPFYQREAGILRRAMDSVYMQRLPEDVSLHVFIIDDSSPQSPAADLEGLDQTAKVSWSVHTQENAGPGGARNRGLDLAETQGFDYIAFLDSDDSWLSTHLAEALAALRRGYDMYFCDNGREGSHESWAEEIDSLRDRGLAIRAKAQESSRDGLGLGFPSGALAAEMVAEYLCQTSAVVLRSSALMGLRFDEELRRAGEDHMFWIQLAVHGAAIFISWHQNVICGRGVNICFASFDWNSPGTLGRVGDQLLLFEKLSRMPQVKKIETIQVRQDIKKYQRTYAFLFIRSVLKGQMPQADGLRKLMRYDPLFLARMPFLFARVALSRDSTIRKW